MFQRTEPEIAMQVFVLTEECDREERKGGSEEEGEQGHRVSAHAVKHTAFTAEQLCVLFVGRAPHPRNVLSSFLFLQAYN